MGVVGVTAERMGPMLAQAGPGVAHRRADEPKGSELVPVKSPHRSTAASVGGCAECSKALRRVTISGRADDFG
jgi:hypothetical protein